ncbi:histone deacetylase [Janibacter sp. GXQ6167]|uniref:histone deacetylase n=1 Tax=Janibacter sp. GXQ6167 TaxID=3240791 RepID=UPI0035268140
MTDEVWYAAYGSNLLRSRFLTYLRGGRPEGALREMSGARDPSDPRDDRPITLPGGLFFGWESLTWGGGIAFYDPDRPGPTLARAYRITSEQLSDLAAQEMHRAPGSLVDLAPVIRRGRDELGPGRYETLHLVGELDGLAVITISASRWADIAPNPPGALYREMIARGLAESHGLAAAESSAYLDRHLSG